MKLVSQTFGPALALGIYGNATEIQTMANRLFNWGATSSNPHYMGENFAYVLTNEEKMINFFANQRSARMRGEGSKSPRKLVRTWLQALAIAKGDFARRITPETFLPKAGEDGEFNHAIGNTLFDGIDQ